MQERRQLYLGLSDIDSQVSYERLIQETSRQLKVCNACRYCEGFCLVWEVNEYRTEFNRGDVEYIGNLCHDCGQCFDVCPYVPPHEFSIDIPAAFSEVRSYTYREYATPRSASGLFENQVQLAWTVAGFSFAVLLVLYVLSGSPARLFDVISGSGSFYYIIPYAVIDSAGITLTLFFFTSWAISAKKFVRATNGMGKISLTDILMAMKDSLVGKWLQGGGAGCNYPKREGRGSYTRFILHSMVLFGFLLDLLATTSAFIEQDFLHIQPPYPVSSTPVIAGLSGGVLIIAGVLLFFFYDSLEDGPQRESMHIMDRVFLSTLLVTAATGILLLVSRATELMGTVMLIHLAVVGTLFVTAPYGKFVHIVYRYLSIAKYHREKRMFESEHS